ncbi:MAG: alpha/beta hydrolase [Isosphaeraceae bacterium]
MMLAEDQQTRIATNGITLHLVEAGPGAGPPVILLHGFPEFWFGWRHQIGALADAGFRVMAPDQRGYNTSDRPPHVSDYNLDTLANDVVGLIESTGRPHAALVGHDWGGIVAWWTAVRHPLRVERLAVLNAPHPVVMRRFLRSSFRQLMKSWYVFFFQLPWLPETVFGRHQGQSRWPRALRNSSRPGTFPRPTSIFIDAPGRARAAAHDDPLVSRGPEKPVSSPGRRPRLGPHAHALGSLGPRSKPTSHVSLALCDQGRLELIEEATHWVQHEEPGCVNRRLIDFLGDPGRH